VDKVTASMIRHIFVVRYYGAFITEEFFITVMEYIRGIDLQRAVDMGAGVPLEINKLVMAQLCCALQHLHMKGFIHRDIKILQAPHYL